MTIGERMREQRIKLDIKPNDIASKIGKSVSTYYRYETGEIEKLTISKMCEIADILKVSPIYLLLGLNSDSEDKASFDFNNRAIMFFSRQLSKLRQSYNLSYSELSEKLKKKSGLNVSAKTIESWEKGIQYPEIISILSISEYFKVTPNYLLGVTLPPIETKSIYMIHEHTGNKHLIKNVAALISAGNLTCEELAEKTGITAKKIEAYKEMRVYSVNPDDAVLIAKAYGVSYLDILYEKDTTPILTKLAYLNGIDLKLVEDYIDGLISNK